MDRDRNNPGFTLIEMLVALAMIATIVSMVYGSYAATSRSLEVYDCRLSCSQRAQLALRFMSRQIRCAYAPIEPNDASTPSSPAQAMQALAKQTWGQESASVFRGDSQDTRGEILRFLTAAGFAGSPTGPQGLSYARYRYDRATAMLSIDLDGSPGRPRPQDSSTNWQPLLQHVKNVDLAFHNGRQWQQKWDFAKEEHLPRAVKINLTVRDERGRDYCLGTTVPISRRVSKMQQAPRRMNVGE